MKDLKGLQQDLFNKAWTHANSMDKPSLNSDGRCAYRGKGGSKCLVGVMIPDEKYEPDIEGFGISSSVLDAVGLGSLTLADKTSMIVFLKNIQNAHDLCARLGFTWAAWKSNMIQSLKDIAFEYNLDIPEPEAS